MERVSRRKFVQAAAAAALLAAGALPAGRALASCGCDCCSSGSDADEGGTVPEAIAGAGAGDVVEFGRWEQDVSASNGAEPIEWVVLAEEDGHKLLVSKYALASRPYNDEYEDVAWETCTLRGWLNDEFYEGAFSAGEQGTIQLAELSNPDNPDYGTEGGDDTRDRVFLLSIDEAERYFADDDARMCAPTHAALDEGIYVYYGNGNGNGCSYWWLRSPGDDAWAAAGAGTEGFVRSHGDSVVNVGVGVRPALWV